MEREFRRLTPSNFKEVLVRRPTRFQARSAKKVETADVCVQHCAQEINTVGAFNCMHHAVEGAGAMAARQDGLIVNVSSIAGMRTYELSGAQRISQKT